MLLAIVSYIKSYGSYLFRLVVGASKQHEIYATSPWYFGVLSSTLASCTHSLITCDGSLTNQKSETKRMTRDPTTHVIYPPVFELIVRSMVRWWPVNQSEHESWVPVKKFMCFSVELRISLSRWFPCSSLVCFHRHVFCLLFCTWANKYYVHASRGPSYCKAFRSIIL